MSCAIIMRIDEIESFASGRTFEDYKSYSMLRSAVERKFEIMGEALTRTRKDDEEVLAKIRDHRDIIFSEHDARRWLLDTDTLIRYLPVDLENAVSIAHANNMYAYDAYFLDCAARHAAPLLTLDRPLKRAAAKTGVHVLEV